MEHATQQPKVVSAAECNAFTVWLGRTLKTCHEEAVHEPIPPELLALLPPASKER